MIFQLHYISLYCIIFHSISLIFTAFHHFSQFSVEHALYIHITYIWYVIYIIIYCTKYVFWIFLIYLWIFFRFSKYSWISGLCVSVARVLGRHVLYDGEAAPPLGEKYATVPFLLILILPFFVSFPLLSSYRSYFLILSL